MKRKATRFLALAMSAVLVTSLTACGDGSDENAKDAVTPVEAQPMLSELELEILNLETKYNKGEFTQEDYLSLADAYNRAGYIRKQRDTSANSGICWNRITGSMRMRKHLLLYRSSA